jgi:hypothetical protein
VYLALLGIDAGPGSKLAGDEPYHLMVADSIVSDHDLDVSNQIRARVWEEWDVADPLPLHAGLVEGRRMDPLGFGFALVIAPLYAIGGPLAVEIGMAAVAALAFVVAMALARRVVPEPWATGGAAMVALSVPALGAATTVGPALLAAAMAGIALMLTLRIRTGPRTIYAYAAALLLAALPWLNPLLLAPAVVVAAPLIRYLVRWRRRLVALVSGELLLMSAVVYITVNDPLYGGWTPDAAALDDGPVSEADFPLGYLDRAWRLIAVWIDRDVGLLRWAPVIALSLLVCWLVWRSRRDLVARVAPERLDVEVSASLLLAVGGAVLVAVTLFAPTLDPDAPPGYPMATALVALAALAGWGWRFARRTGMVLAAISLVASVWLYVALRTGHGTWSDPPQEIPFGPVVDVLPSYASAAPLTIAWTAAVAAGVAGLVLWEWWVWRREGVDLTRSPGPGPR